jgi:hypothetical protein
MKLFFLALICTNFLSAAPKTWDAVGRLRPGTPVEVVTSTGSETGQVVSSSTENLTIRTNRGEHNFARPDIIRVTSRTKSKRVRNMLIGAGVGLGISLLADRTIGTYIRNESSSSGRPFIWTIPIAAGAGIGAAFPSYPVVYRK